MLVPSFVYKTSEKSLLVTRQCLVKVNIGVESCRKVDKILIGSFDLSLLDFPKGLSQILALIFKVPSGLPLRTVEI